MFCPNCGAEINDAAVICVHCKTSLEKKLLSKKDFLKTKASVKTKSLYTVARIIGVIGLAVLVLSACLAIYGSFFDIPLFSMFDEFEIKQLEEEYEELAEEYGDVMENATAEELKDLEDEVGIESEDIEKIMKNPSLRNFSKIADSGDYDEDVTMAFSLIFGLIIGGVALIALFELLSVLLRSPALAIIAIIVSPLYFFLFSGAMMFVCFLIVNVAQVIVYSLANKEYKTYKREFVR